MIQIKNAAELEKMRKACAISAAAGLRAAPASRCLSPCVWAAVRSAARSTLPAPMCAWPAGAKAHPAIACRRRWMCACRHGPYAAALWPRRGNARPNARRPCPCILNPAVPRAIPGGHANSKSSLVRRLIYAQYPQVYCSAAISAGAVPARAVRAGVVRANQRLCLAGAKRRYHL